MRMSNFANRGFLKFVVSENEFSESGISFRCESRVFESGNLANAMFTHAVAPDVAAYWPPESAVCWSEHARVGGPTLHCRCRLWGAFLFLRVFCFGCGTDCWYII